MNTKDGGQAFPVPPDTSTPVIKGMSLRDYFAAHSMLAMMANPRNRCGLERIAKQAYFCADCMIAERMKD